MSICKVTFFPQKKEVSVEKGTSLIDAVSKANITINNLCGGDGICGRCKMIVKEGEVQAEVSPKLTREEIKNGYVLACMTTIASDIVVEIPEQTLAKEKIRADRDAERFRNFEQTVLLKEYEPHPLVRKVYLELEPPTLANNTADHERVNEALCKKIGSCETQMGLKIIKALPDLLRESGFKITATIGLRGHVAEIMNIEAG
ncbi:MAG: 2Fe-2S iron-sulfur cluster binding domain-containing protein, partial [Spirochaetes bacterium]|nr:2Fe-2S iron-sulfur cluster binding domain-containing protein [Spirochaetota bacterium]